MRPMLLGWAGLWIRGRGRLRFSYHSLTGPWPGASSWHQRSSTPTRRSLGARWPRARCTECWHGMGGGRLHPVRGIPRQTQRRRPLLKKLSAKIAEETIRQAELGRPVRLMFQDEGRFGRHGHHQPPRCAHLQPLMEAMGRLSAPLTAFPTQPIEVHRGASRFSPASNSHRAVRYTGVFRSIHVPCNAPDSRSARRPCG
jgi:hypothetical protein